MSGEPQVLAVAHHTFGTLEARRGDTERALRHFKVSRQYVDKDQNVWLSAAITLDESTTRGMQSDLDGALALAEVGGELAKASGWSKGVVAAAANRAHLYLLTGRYEQVELALAEASRERFSSPTYEFALLNTRSLLALARHDYEAAAKHLADQQELRRHLGTWYLLPALETLVRLQNRTGQWEAAARVAHDALAIAKEQRFAAFVPILQLRRAFALHAAGKNIGVADFPWPVDADAWPVSTIATAWLVRGKASNNPAYVSRGLRYLEAAGDVNGLNDAKELVGATRAATPPATLESAAALLEVAAYPSVLAKEAFSLLDGLGCIKKAAVFVRGEHQLRAIELRGWTELEAVAALERGPSHFQASCGGSAANEVWLVAEPQSDLEHWGQWIAVRNLIRSAVELARSRSDQQQRTALWPTETLDADPDAIWVSEQSLDLLRTARRIAPSDLTVLLTGESGTGKEMLARAVHMASGRAAQKMLAFNCTAVPREMFESQLFGYRKGAFTGAETAFSGLIRAAEGGTLFLDEIADVPLDIQPKLLRFLESHEIQPLGEPQPIKVDVRVIAATNISLDRLVADGRFREDLYYRLNVVRLQLPPLRERREEIPALAEHYLRKFAAQQKKARLILSDEALEYLLLYAWPGNIRQLANEIHRMVALAEPDAVLTAVHLSPEIQASRRTIPASGSASELRINLHQPLPDAVDLLERTMVEAALKRTDGRLEDAARALGISRKGLFLKRRRWGMQTSEA